MKSRVNLSFIQFLFLCIFIFCMLLNDEEKNIDR